MKFFAVSALAAVASATTHYGTAKFGTTGLTTGYTTGLTGLSTGYTTGLTGLSTGYTTGLTGFGFGTGYGTAGYVTPAVHKVGYVAQPVGVHKVGLTHNNYVHGLHGLHGNYVHGLHGNYAGGYSYGQAAVAPLAVQSTHQVHYADHPSGGQINPISVEIDANPIPMNMLFKSASSQLNVEQAHNGAQGSVQESASEDEAHVLKHSVTKPIVQEVREVITPFRKINQEVMPVQEAINTVVARGQYSAPVYSHGAHALHTVGHVRPALQTVVAAAPAVAETVAVAAPVATTYQTGYVAPTFKAAHIEHVPAFRATTFAHAPAYKAAHFAHAPAFKAAHLTHTPAFKATTFTHTPAFKATSVEFNKDKTVVANGGY